MSFRAITLNSPHRYDEPRTLLASPIERRVLVMQAQPGVGFAASWRLTLALCYTLTSPRELCQERVSQSVSSAAPQYSAPDVVLRNDYTWV